MNINYKIFIVIIFIFIYLAISHGQIYMYENDSLIQKVEFFRLEDKINFTLEVENKSLNILSTLHGTFYKDYGVHPLEPDYLMCLNDLKKVFFGLKYMYSIEKTNSVLYMYLEHNSKNTLIIEEYNCNKLRSKYCPFESQGLLKKVEESDAKQGED